MSSVINVQVDLAGKKVPLPCLANGNAIKSNFFKALVQHLTSILPSLAVSLYVVFFVLYSYKYKF